MKNEIAIVKGIILPEFNLLQLGAGVIIAVVLATVLAFWINGVRTQRRVKNDIQYSSRKSRTVTTCGRSDVSGEESA